MCVVIRSSVVRGVAVRAAWRLPAALGSVAPLASGATFAQGAPQSMALTNGLFRSERRPNLPDGVAFRNGQAGDAGWIHLATSWEVVPNVRLGINAYYLTQFRDNRTNGRRVPMAASACSTQAQAACGGSMPTTSCSPIFTCRWT